MSNNIIYYDGNSIDCKLAIIINNYLFNYPSIPVYGNLDEFEPPNVNNRYARLANNYWFIGLKPSNQFLTNMQASVNINIFYKNININDYINIQNTVNIPIVTYLSLAYTFFYYQTNTLEFELGDFKNLEINKLKLLLTLFENHIATYTNPLLNYNNVSVFNTICSWTNVFIPINELNLNRLLLNNENLVSQLLGSITDNYLKHKVSEIVGNSKIQQKGEYFCLMINLSENEIIMLDSYITKFIFDNNILIDFIEYYTIDENLEINVNIKKFNMFVSIVEIPQQLMLLEHIGLVNKTRILQEVLVSYYQIDVETNTDLKIKTNGLIKFKTTMNKFFNI